MTHTPDDPTQAQIWLDGVAPNQELSIYVPRGDKGDPGGITLGTDLGTTTDLNTVISSGVYRLSSTQSGLQLRNFPRDNDTGVLVVHARVADGATAIQEWYPISSTTTIGSFRRTRQASVWGPWRFIPVQRVDQTAGRAIYKWDDVNGREQLVYGDTGQRNIVNDQAWVDALFPAGIIANTGGGGIVRVRRLGYQVELMMAVDKAASGSISSANAFPLGFRPSQPVHALGANSSFGLVRAYHGGGTGGLNWNSTAAQTAVSICFNYSTIDAWPTTLPGTAVGSIPNL